MMQRTSLLCSSSAFSSLPSSSHRPTSLPFHLYLLPPSHSLHFPFNLPPATSSRLLIFPPLHTTATDEILETSDAGSRYVDIGYVSSVHGLLGEIRVKPNTDFPKLQLA